MTYKRKKSMTIEATQWFKNGDHPDDYAGSIVILECTELRSCSGEERRKKEWEGSIVRYYRHLVIDGSSKCSVCGKTMNEHGFIDQDGRGYRVCPGDYVITRDDGKYYPMSAEEFEATFEKV